MKIFFSGVGDAKHINQKLEHPVVPQLDDNVMFIVDGIEEDWNVRAVVHCPGPEFFYDVYCVVGLMRA